MELRKAQRQIVKLRIGLSGPSGSGKTRSALELAYGITRDWTKIAVIDSENGSADLYSDLGPYSVLSLEAPYTPERYTQAINACDIDGIEVIIIDSISHEWEGRGGALETNDKLAQAKFKGNTWGAWSETTPRHQEFIQSILTSSKHIITTARSKVETAQIEDNGRKKVVKLGMKEITREGFEYELTINFNLDREKHLAIASKDRTGLFIDRDPFIITAETGRELVEWNNTGVDGQELEAERKRKADEEAKKKAEELDRFYNEMVSTLEEVKFIDDLAKLWNITIGTRKKELTDEQYKDLADRKDAIKAQLMGGGTKPADPAASTEYKKPAEVKTPPPPKAAPETKKVVKKEEVTATPVKEEVAQPPARKQEGTLEERIQIAEVELSRARRSYEFLEDNPKDSDVYRQALADDKAKIDKMRDNLLKMKAERDSKIAPVETDLEVGYIEQGN